MSHSYDSFLSYLNQNTQESLLLAQNEIDDINTLAAEARAKLDTLQNQKITIVEKDTIVDRSKTIITTIFDETFNQHAQLQNVVKEAKLFKDNFTMEYNTINDLMNTMKTLMELMQNFSQTM